MRAEIEPFTVIASTSRIRDTDVYPFFPLRTNGDAPLDSFDKHVIMRE